jgi:hypothetical protein
MDGYRDMPVEEMVHIEDKDDLSNCPESLTTKLR